MVKIAARKPLLRTGNKQKRLVWAKEHKEWTLDQWKSMLWSDESKFEIFGSNHRVFVRRRKACCIIVYSEVMSSVPISESEGEYQTPRRLSHLEILDEISDSPMSDDRFSIHPTEEIESRVNQDEIQDLEISVNLEDSWSSTHERAIYTPIASQAFQNRFSILNNEGDSPSTSGGANVSEEALHSKMEEDDGIPEGMEPYLVRRLSCRNIQLPPLAFRLAEQAEWEKKPDCESPQRPTSLALRIPPLIAITAADSTR
ncbi:unnamed protein product [Ranitomeya imitator]|uniref:Transposase n=1 Tax=Ranitomeya imitator TaxID=111125 RepID=A0ABN9LWD1_9NEOB|nr:unnamed protein product [Ranitomeya imitator]